MIRILPDSNTLQLPCGDTGLLSVHFEGVQTTAQDRAVLAVYDECQRQEVLRKISTPADNAAAFLFENADTRELPPGRYRYDIRLALEAEIVDGQITGAREIHSVFALDTLPVLEIKPVCAQL